jgi:cytochrome c1
MKKFLATLALGLTTLPAFASSEVHLEQIQVDNSKAAIERGMDVVIAECTSCHSLKYIHYRNLIALGVDKKKVDGLRGDKPLDAALMSAMPDDAAMSSFGKIPPDLSLMFNAREGRGNYTYSYLTAFYKKPDGTLDNHVFPGVKMPDILAMSEATDEAQRTAIKAKAKDIVSFLAWAADPHEQDRIQLGKYLMGYLVVLTTLLYFLKKRIWAKLK